jgi:hypothetical protein
MNNRSSRPSPSAGYSGTPLLAKLGIKPGFRVGFVAAPEGFVQALGLPASVVVVRGPRARPLDVVLLFTPSLARLEAGFSRYARRLVPAGMLWVAWPKKASGVPTDLSEDRVRAIGLAAGLVDVKVCAVDSVWSALKFVRRLRDR